MEGLFDACADMGMRRESAKRGDDDEPGLRRVGRCRVVCNPRGYAQNRKEAASVADLLFGNPAFRSEFVIDLPWGGP